MSTKVVLCITEGDRTEIDVIQSLKLRFMADDNIEVVSFFAEVYQFYKHIKSVDDGYVDTFSVLKGRSPENELFARYTRDQIAEIYLFFDYDGHATQADDERIEEMLRYFDNETEMGKMYISYPMVEAFKDPLPHSVPCCFPKCSYVSLGGAYKKAVNLQCNSINNKLHKPYNLTNAEWRTQLSLSLMAGNFVVGGRYTLPDSYDVFLGDLGQVNIFNNQKARYIDPYGLVAILSAFAFFVIEYRGRELFEEWKGVCGN